MEDQIDETAIFNGLIIKNPSSTLDDKKNVQWIAGAINKSQAKNIFLTLVPNRKISTLLGAFEKKYNEQKYLDYRWLSFLSICSCKIWFRS
ncbi:hypothetical protein H311_02415 [Anncaliia algerae PRA109]|nr:hypothetical protein H311_02415 [Anncaliia algerae PRA109]